MSYASGQCWNCGSVEPHGEIEFLNVDLDMVSMEDLMPLLNEWGDKIFLLRNEKVDELYYVSLELNHVIEGTPDDLLNTYFLLINSLSADSKVLWANCVKRVFDLGFSSGLKPHVIHEAISHKTMAQLVEIKASLVVTIYAVPYDKGTNHELTVDGVILSTGRNCEV